jgi:S-adenosylmethionine:tRNA ribosyltransferase-isomerase
MDVQDFDYALPRERIAQYPPPRRDDSRLLVLCRNTGDIHHARFQDLLSWLSTRDLLVVNDTRVVPARLCGRRTSGAKVEILLCEPLSPEGHPLPPTEESGAFQALTWRCLVRSGEKLRAGTEIVFDDATRGVLQHREDGAWRILFSGAADLRALMDRAGQVPLPPYVQREPTPIDRVRYQTLFARKEGSIAAPTAGLHFTEELLDRLKGHGVRLTSVTLQVGIGTFRPVRTSRVEDHVMHQEFVEVGKRCCRAWRETRMRGGRVIAVGTTTVRALESAVDHRGRLMPFRGFTRLFIFPGYGFRAIDALVTNFHLPKSTLLMLVMAFAGKDQIKRAYEEAIRRGYRFYSYGDAMLIQ